MTTCTVRNVHTGAFVQFRNWPLIALRTAAGKGEQRARECGRGDEVRESHAVTGASAARGSAGITSR